MEEDEIHWKEELEKIQKLDDLKNIRGKISINPRILNKILKKYVSSSNYNDIISLLNKNKSLIQKTYSMKEGETYAEAVHKLQKYATDNQPQFTLKDGSKIYRPLTLKENMIASLEHNILFSHIYHTCTGIVFRRRSNLYKINPEVKELINIPKGFSKEYMDIDYENFDGEEIDDKSCINDEDIILLAMGGINSENKDLLNNFIKNIGIFSGHYYIRFKVKNPNNTLDQLTMLHFGSMKNLGSRYSDRDSKESEVYAGYLNKKTSLLMID